MHIHRPMNLPLEVPVTQPSASTLAARRAAEARKKLNSFASTVPGEEESPWIVEPGYASAKQQNSREDVDVMETPRISIKV